MRGLIGYTGFVGSNLIKLTHFDQLYNTKNIRDIGGQHFDLLVCAAPQAKKWWANQHPEEDLALIQDLISQLERVEAAQFVLTSTVDVFPRVTGVDETFDCGREMNHAYGKNRHYLEQFVTSRFPEAYIVRLPALFGPGLKKNVIYDLLHHNQLDVINPDSQFQWYDITRLWGDLKQMMAAKLSLAMLATEPVATGDICSRFFPSLKIGSSAAAQACYDVRTCHNDVLGGDRGYIRSKEEVLADIGQFVAAHRLGEG